MCVHIGMYACMHALVALVMYARPRRRCRVTFKVVVRWVDKIVHEPQQEEHDRLTDSLPLTPLMSMLMTQIRDAGFRPFADMPFLRAVWHQY